MKFRIGAIFSQVGISFKVSHKVIKLIWSDLEERVPLSEEYEKKFRDYTLVFLYSAREQNDFLVKGPTISKRYKVIEYVIYMPFKEIQSDEEIYNVFLMCMEKGVREVFRKYNINQNELKDIFYNVRKKVIGNIEYSNL
ncbi:MULTISPECIES: hypothetical protein [unclassified Gilliamella]|uniref:hypothetical protein n=1 Tax=unclassified Gilliamella TaxID=2685620 RepID=UPI00130A2FD0|nr:MULTISPECIES: hypothetical protein [unclassified Gilliamella]MWP50274.1 hypothetical protein [Gilliamella sp. Lep-s35]MWP69620.1 hypothetical protein [Gilliamella sp. Lep-s5]MWP77889.1 hypothetical protein [Gilliamella sp. Lep-s21]